MPDDLIAQGKPCHEKVKMSDDSHKMSDRESDTGHAPSVSPDVPLATALVDRVLELTRIGIPDTVGARARTLLADTLAVGVAGAVTEESRLAREVALGWGGPPEASIWGGGGLLGAGHAAFVNAHQIHTLEWDPIHEPAVVHAMTVVTPVTLAWAMRESRRGRTVSGRALLDGIIAGVDVAGGLGAATTTPLQFFRPATAGCLGAVVAVGVAGGFPASQILAALGIAYGAVSGTMQPHTEGAQVLALQVGFNARSALNAWDLAEAGFDGPRYILEGKYGYFRLIEAGGEPDRVVSERGTIWEIDRTSIKPFPSGRATHGALDGLLQLKQRHGFTRSDISRIEVSVPPMVFNLVGRRPTADMPIGAARLCLAYLVPCLLDDGTIDVDTYRPDRIRDPEILEWTEQVTVRADDNPDPNAFNPQRVVVHLGSGEVHDIEVPYSLGSPEYPLTPEQARAKFNRAMAIGGREDYADRLFEYVMNIDSAADVSDLWALL